VTCSATDPACGLFQNGPGPFGCSALAAGDCVNSIVDACSDLNAQGLTIAPLSAKLAGLNTTTCAVTANPPGSRVVPGQTASIFPINNATTVPGTNVVFPNLTDVNQSDNGLAKIDYHINDHNTVNFYYFIGENNGTWADGANELAPNWQSLLYVRSQLFNGAWTLGPELTMGESIPGRVRPLYPKLPQRRPHHFGGSLRNQHGRDESVFCGIPDFLHAGPHRFPRGIMAQARRAR